MLVVVFITVIKDLQSDHSFIHRCERYVFLLEAYNMERTGELLYERVDKRTDRRKNSTVHQSAYVRPVFYVIYIINLRDPGPRFLTRRGI